MCLQERQVWGHVESDTSSPCPPRGPAGSPPSAQYTAWQAWDNVAKSQIMLNVSANQQAKAGDLNGDKTARQVWATLEAAFTDTSLSARMALQSRLFSFRMLPGVSVQDHVNSLLELANKLRTCGEQVTDSLLIARLLKSMPADYKDLVDVLRYQVTSTPHTFESVRQQLLAMETELKADQADAESQAVTVAAHVARVAALAAPHRAGAAQQSYQSNRRHQRPMVICANPECRKKGHTIDDCWMINGYPEGRGPHSHGGGLGKRARQPTLDRPRDSPYHPSSASGRTSSASSSFQHPGGATPTVVRSFLMAVHQPVESATAAMSAMSRTQPSPGPKSASASSIGATPWYLDSGASCNLSYLRDQMKEYRQIDVPQQVLAGNSATMAAVGTGTMSVWMYQSEHGAADNVIETAVDLRDVLYVPGLSANLLSVRKLASAGYVCVFRGDTATIEDRTGHVWATAERCSTYGLYRLWTRPRTQSATAAALVAPIVTDSEAAPTVTTTVSTVANTTVKTNTDTTTRLWHDRLNHLGLQQMHSLRRLGVVHGAFDIPAGASNQSDGYLPCESCQVGKSHRAAMPKVAAQRTTRCLELVHSDLCGPFKVTSLNGFQYVTTFIDDFSRFIAIYPIREKSEAFSCFKQYKAAAEMVTGQKLAALRTDRGGEYLSKEFSTFLTAAGIQHELTPPYTPQHNGVAERANRTIFDAVRAMLHRAGLSSYFWAEAAQAAVHVRNRCSTRAVPGATPYQVWTGRRPSIENLRVFGCVAYVHVVEQKRSDKLGDRSIRCIHVGYSAQSKAYRLYNPATDKVVVSRDVTFEEQKFVDPSSSLARQHLGEGELLAFPDVAGRAPVVTRRAPIQAVTSSSSTQAISPSAQPSISSHSDSPMVVTLSDDDSDDDMLEEIAISDGDYDDEKGDPHYIGRSHRAGSDADEDAVDLLPSSSLIATHAPSAAPDQRRRSNRGGGLASSRAHAAADAAAAAAAAPQVLDQAAFSAFIPAVDDEPSTFQEAMSRADSHLWQEAMQAEMESIHRTGTWVLTPLPHDRQLVGCKWVFKIKRKADGTVD
jgi:transposase InsO family protein